MPNQSWLIGLVGGTACDATEVLFKYPLLIWQFSDIVPVVVMIQTSLVLQFMGLELASQSECRQGKRFDVIREFQRHDGDVGSPEVMGECCDGDVGSPVVMASWVRASMY